MQTLAFLSLILLSSLVARASQAPGRIGIDVEERLAELTTKHEEACLSDPGARVCLFAPQADDQVHGLPQFGRTWRELDQRYKKLASHLLPIEAAHDREVEWVYATVLERMNELYPRSSEAQKRTILRLAHELNELWMEQFGAEWEMWLAQSRERTELAAIQAWLLYSAVFASSFRFQKVGALNRYLKSRWLWPAAAAGSLNSTLSTSGMLNRSAAPLLPSPPFEFLTLEGEAPRSVKTAAQRALDEQILFREMGTTFASGAAVASFGPHWHRAASSAGRLQFLRRMGASLKLTPWSVLFGWAVGAGAEWAFDRTLEAKLLHALLEANVDSKMGVRFFQQTLNELDLFWLQETEAEIARISTILKELEAPTSQDVRASRLLVDNLAGDFASYRQITGTCERPGLFMRDIAERLHRRGRHVESFRLTLRSLMAKAGSPLKIRILSLRERSLAVFSEGVARAATEIGTSDWLQRRLSQLTPCVHRKVGAQPK